MDWIRVEGDSMRPFLSPGDSVRVQWAAHGDQANYRVGELVIGRDADPAGEWVVHRVVGSGGAAPRRYRLKGDAAFASDDLDDAQIWGRVIGVLPASGNGAPASSRAVRAGALDRWIARFSRFALPPESLSAKASRRIVFALAYLRRRYL
jgi:hypothetical protein